MQSSLNQFLFSVPTSVKFGAGCRSEILIQLQKKAWDRVGVVVDHNLISVPQVSQILQQLQENLKQVVVLPCTVQEPDYDSLDQMRGVFKDQPLQAIIGIGGGSALDCAKAMAVLINNKEGAISYRGFDKMTAPVLPIIAVPTTAGTGSEVTPNASFVDSHAKRKLGINGEAVRPCLAFLDPELTLSCPARPSLSAGVDSMVHAAEAFVAKKTNIMAQRFSRDGFSLVFNNLPLVMREPQHLDYRTQVMFGAFLSGVALMHSGTGPSAALSYPLGVHYKVPHGIAGGIFLPHVIEYNVEQGVKDYADMFDWSGEDAKLTRGDRARKFVQLMKMRWESLEVPKKLSQVSSIPVDIDLMVRDTLELAGALEQNPVPFGEKEIRLVLSRLI